MLMMFYSILMRKKDANVSLYNEYKYNQELINYFFIIRIVKEYLI